MRCALKSKNMVLANQAQMMIEKAQTSIASATKSLDDVRKKQKSVEARKRENLEKTESSSKKRKL